MNPKARSWVRRAQALTVIIAIFAYIIFVGDSEFLAKAGIARVEGPWMRRIALSRGVFAVACLLMVLYAFRFTFYTKEMFGFIAVSSVANLVTDFPILFQLGLEAPSVLYIALFAIRLAVCVLTLSLFLDFDSAPRERRLTKTLFSIRLQ